MPEMFPPSRLPLSAAQTGLWFAHQLDSTGRGYNVGEYFAIDGPVDHALMEQAWHTLLLEADVLRVRTISEDDDGLWQYLDDTLPPLPAPDFSAEPDPMAAAEAWMRADLNRPVDLAAGGLSTFALVKVADRRFLYFHRFHHLVIDGVAGAMVGRRIAELYTALTEGRAAEPCDFLPLTDVLAEDAAYRASDQAAADRTHWAERLASLPAPVTLPGTPRAHPPHRNSPPERPPSSAAPASSGRTAPTSSPTPRAPPAPAGRSS